MIRQAMSRQSSSIDTSSKLLKIGLSEDAVRHKMIKADISHELVDIFFVDFYSQLDGNDH